MKRKGYQDSLQVEKRSRKILHAWLKSDCDEGRFVLTDKGRLSKEMQCRFGDVLAQKNGLAVWIELKAEMDFTGNFFIEEWSNRKWGNPGWLYKLDTDLLFYHFVIDGLLYIINFQQLKKWLLEMPPDWCRYKPRQINLCQYDEKKQGKYAQKNDTWGRTIPVGDIFKTLNVDMDVIYLNRKEAAQP